MMQAGRWRAILVAMVACTVCSAAFGQADGGAELHGRIQAAESAVSSDQGRMDGVSWLRLAILYQDVARYDESERTFRKATSLLRSGDRGVYAEALDRMGLMYVERGKSAKGETLERKALQIRQERHDATATGKSYMHLALAAYGRHDMRGAQANAEIAVSLLAPEHAGETKAESATPEEKMSALIDLALIQCAQGDCDLAEHDLDRALRLAMANYPSNSVPVGFVNFLLGYAHTKSGDVQSGAALMKTGIEEMKTQMGWGHPTYVAALKEYQAVLMRAGRTKDASYVEESIAKLSISRGSAGNSTPAGFLGMSALR